MNLHFSEKYDFGTNCPPISGPRKTKINYHCSDRNNFFEVNI